MENAKRRCEKGEIDAIVHMGDHAYESSSRVFKSRAAIKSRRWFRYDLGFIGDRRGDACAQLTPAPPFPLLETPFVCGARALHSLARTAESTA